MTDAAREHRKHRLAAWADRLGVTRAIATLPHRQRLLVFNYHRIGDPAIAPYDLGTYSSTADDFAAQMEFLRDRIGVLSLDQALAWLAHPASRRGAGVLITFDDGYVDNYRIAYPVLCRLGVPATFFLATAFVGTNHLPWWDRIAQCVRGACVDRFELDYPTPIAFDLAATPRMEIVSAVVRLYKSPAMIDPERFLQALRTACGLVDSGEPERLFLDWDEARDMLAHGMSIGSHTHTHELLAKQTLDDQIAELTTSRALLEQQLHVPIDVAAYPVGAKTAFSPATYTALQHAGYRAAFSYYGGLNAPGATDPYDIRRMRMDAATSLPLFRLRTAFAAASGHALT